MIPSELVTPTTVSVTEWVAVGGLVVSALTAIFVIVKALIDKFGKSPEARQAEIALGVGILQSQIERNAQAEERWLKQEQFLREELRRSGTEKEALEELLDDARKEIRTLREENELFRQRQRTLAGKIARGESITLADITGETSLHVVMQDDDDLEDTFRLN